MFRKTVITALTLAIVAGATFIAPTAASAKDGRNAAAVIGALVGIGAAIAGSAASAQPEYERQPREYRPQRQVRAYDLQEEADEDEPVRCFDRPVTRWSSSLGEPVIIGHKRICR